MTDLHTQGHNFEVCRNWNFYEENPNRCATSNEDREDRLVTAEILVRMFRSTEPIKLRGAVITGSLSGFDHGQQLPPVEFISCWFEDGVNFDGVTFTGKVSFNGTVFAGSARFEGARFAGDARFEKTEFRGEAVFCGATIEGAARFYEAKFAGETRFHNATFKRVTQFDKATFRSQAWFTNATFDGDAQFEETIFDANQHLNHYEAKDAPKFGADFLKAVFAHDAHFLKGYFNTNARFEDARFEGDARFGQGMFGGLSHFYHAAFIGKADFAGTTFTGTAGFSHAKFNNTAWFDSATFDSDQAKFEDASFGGRAEFIEATFMGKALFKKADFQGDAQFRAASFRSDACFPDTVFTGKAGFSEVAFIGNAKFDKTQFNGGAWFDRANFHGRAEYRGASFKGEAAFGDTLATRLMFENAEFYVGSPGPWIAPEIDLNGAVLAVRGRVEIKARRIEASRLVAREGAQLVIQCPNVDLSETDFSRRSVVSPPAAAVSDPLGDMNPKFYIPTAEPAWTARRDELRGDLIDLPIVAGKGHAPTPECRVKSLEGANVSELVLSKVVLDDCLFAGAQGLDRLRIDTGCSFEWTDGVGHWLWWLPSRVWRHTKVPIPMVRRRIIAEELWWHGLGTGRRGTNPSQTNYHDCQASKRQTGVRAAEPQPVRARNKEPANQHGIDLSASEIAEIYRGLRKGLEDAKNEPGAADFYYGEMEMRRQANRRPRAERSHDPRPWLFRHRSFARADALNPQSTWVERVLLYGYWMVSGYGLRAWRAVLALGAVLLAASLLYMSGSFAHGKEHSPQMTRIEPGTGAVFYRTSHDSPPGFEDTLEFSAKESISLLRAPQESFEMTSSGKALDFGLRIAGPVLLAYIVLALRARTKR
jgi:Pentapeptide repeats (9 copies)